MTPSRSAERGRAGWAPGGICYPRSCRRIETIFSWPGLGRLTYLAIGNQDYALLQGLFLLFSAAVIVSNLVADLLYSHLDPRVRAA